jgi:dihydrofolate reductase
MGKVIVIQFITLDGVTQDPDGSEGFAHGGWAFRFGPQAVAGDKFKLGALFESGALLLGRRTWQLFAGLWPSRSDEFSRKMNAIPKLVASHTLERVDAWNNSTLLTGDLIAEVRKRKDREDLIIVGSDSIVQLLREHDLIDEYRLLIFPIVLGGGRRLFPEGARPNPLETLGVEQSGAACLIRLGRSPTFEPDAAAPVLAGRYGL